MNLMAIKQELKDLKLGTKSAADLAYLQSLTADFFADRQHEELLSDWNHLQKTPGRTRIFTFATKRCPEKIAHYLEETFPFNRHENDNGEYVWDNRPQPPFYAYIKHDNDTPGKVVASDPESGIHYHFYLEFANARSFASVATELGIPVTMLQGIKVNKKAILQYLTHENDPSKHHYSPSDIHANFDVVKERQQEEFSHRELWEDYYKMRTGKMTYKQFFDKYEICIVRHSFSQSLKLAETAFNAEQNNFNERGRYMK